MISYAFTFPNTPSLGLAASPARAAREPTAPGETGSPASIARALPCPRLLRRGRVTLVNQKAALAVGALAGAAAAFVLGRRRVARPVPQEAPGPTPPEDLQSKLAEART